jgi:hypothetical protein
MNLMRHSKNRPGQNPQIFPPARLQIFSTLTTALEKSNFWRAGGINLNGSNRRTVFRMPSATKTQNHLPHLSKTDNNQKPLNLVSVFSKQAQPAI